MAGLHNFRCLFEGSDSFKVGVGIGFRSGSGIMGLAGMVRVRARG